MRAPGATLAVCVSLLAGAAPARADVVIGPGVPFSAGELESALAARTPASALLTLDVRAAGPGRLLVVGATGRWEVDLGGATGANAARLVALNVVGAGMVATNAADALGAVEPPPPPPLAVEETARRSPGRSPLPVSITLAGGAQVGLGADDLAAGVARLEVATGRRWWLAAAFEWQEDRGVAPAGAAAVDGGSWLVRGLGGLRQGRVEVGLGPLAGRVRVDTVDGAEGWQSGVAAVTRARVAIARRWSAVIGVGADAYRHRIEVRRGGELVAATPRVAVAMTLGLRWEPGR